MSRAHGNGYQPMSTSNVELDEVRVDAAGSATRSRGGTYTHIDQFLQGIMRVDGQLALVRRGMQELDGIHKRLLQPISEADAHALNQSVTRKYDEVKGTLDDVGMRIKELEKDAGNATAEGTGDRPMARNQLRNVGRKYRDAVAEFRQAEMEHQRRAREHMARQLRVVRPEATAAEIDALLDSPPDGQPVRIFADNVMQSGRYANARNALREVEDRHIALVQLNQQVEELAQLFMDVATMVEDQDARIDAIFANADSIAKDITTGADEVEKAKEHRKNQIKLLWKLSCLLVVIVIAAVLYFLFGTSAGQTIIGSGSSSSSSPTPTPTTVTVTATPTATAPNAPKPT
ncbi:hypothetical protein H9P43_000994 [Blastocladiella emersonii ATCC 22665]|nr:hypothetical protein H9P43_000994 [Blastocladiella emersonii ATCC 22665]